MLPMKIGEPTGALVFAVLVIGQLAAQQTQQNQARSKASIGAAWEVAVAVDGYIVSDHDDYVSPTLSADRGVLHLEGRYNYENLRTGSVWLGYNISTGRKVVFDLTPMIGGVFGRTTGFAPGFEASLTYKKIRASISNEYVFDTGDNSGSFYYSWPEVSCSLTEWLRLGLAAQRIKPFQTKLDTQRGFLIGLSHKKAGFTTYIFNAGWTQPSLVLEAGWSF
jgi:hypothetical protein